MTDKLNNQIDQNEEDAIMRFALRPAKFANDDVVDNVVQLLFERQSGFAFLPYNYLSINSRSAEILVQAGIPFKYMTREEVSSLFGNGGRLVALNEEYRFRLSQKYGIKLNSHK